MRACLLPLERCEVCRGAGRIRGIFHLMACAGCNGGGFVKPDGTALEYPELVEQLRLRLSMSGAERKRLQQVLERVGLQPVEGAVSGYQGNNKKGAGGAHFTGD
ncbi:hypothetical protein ACOQNP_12195 [Ectopseudomonas khazarica]|uniref:hypothetical protein n=1 Tax=Ectopseudomonas khazarica TaxID=2502979 RepID=UPI003B961BAB